MKRLSSQEKSWILYDVGNSPFLLVIVSAILPIFFKDVASQGIEQTTSTSNWAFANAFASLLVVLLAPVLGVLADYRDWKRRFLGIFLAVGVLATLLLTTVGAGNWIWCLSVLVIARVGYAGANLVYDALLVDITDERRRDWISSSGYAWGYIGSVVPFLAAIAVIFSATPPGESSAIPVGPAKIAFVIVAIWWLAFSVPILRNVRQVHFIEPAAQPIRDAFTRLLHTFDEVRKHRSAFLFLVAYFFYIDGLNTITTMAGVYGREIGLGVTQLILALLMGQIVAFPFSLLYGRLAERFSARAMLFTGIGVYTVLTLVAYLLPALPTLEMKVTTFWVLAFFVGTSQGGIQALSRSFFSRLIPARCSGEFFGFYNVVGRFAAISGPLLVGTIGRLSGHSHTGLLSIVVLFAIGAAVLARIEDSPRSG